MGTNGLLSFDPAYNPFSNEVFPGGSDTSSRYLVAPFWDDTDISSDEVGQISYEIHESGYYLEQVADFLRRKRPSSFIGTWMLVAYWDSVRPFPGSSATAVSASIVSQLSLFEVCELITATLINYLQENSFQAILITDGTNSYSIFTYDCSRTEWGSSVTIGFSAAGEPYANHDPSSSDIASLNTPDSNVIYRLSDMNPEVSLPGELLFLTFFSYRTGTTGYNGDLR